MPSSTSKIPLPLSVTSPSRTAPGMPEPPPVVQQSRIPLVKGVRSPVSELPPALRESGIPSPGNGVRPDLPLSPALRSEVLLPGAKEHNSGGGKGARRSRIPDIRSRVSPGKEILSPGREILSSSREILSPSREILNSGREGEEQEQTRIPKSSSSSRLPTVARKDNPPSRLPATPSRLAAPSASSSRPNNRHHRKSSVESLSGEELEWDGKEFPPSSPPLPLPSSSSSPTRSSSNSLSSSSSSPHKRGREQEVPPSKMRRTSPDGESVSPSKTRRPSPSKIPVAGNYVSGKTPNSSSNEDFLTPKGQQQRDPWGQDRELRHSPSLQSEMFSTAPESEGEDDNLERREEEEEEEGWGAGEDMAPCEGGEGFVPCEPLPREPTLSHSHTKTFQPTNSESQTFPHENSESQTFQHDNSESQTFQHDNSEPQTSQYNDSEHRTPQPRPSPSRDPCTPGSNPRSRIPAPNSSPTRSIPQLNWSISREDSPRRSSREDSLRGSSQEESPRRSSQEDSFKRGSQEDSLKRGSQEEILQRDSTEEAHPRHSSFTCKDDPRENGQDTQNTIHTSQSTSRLPDPLPSGEPLPPTAHRPSHSTSRLPFLPLTGGSSSSGSGSTDSDSSEGGHRRRRNFEAFVMTGDRMINLAKTPANADFVSKYYRPSTNTTARVLDSAFKQPGLDAPSEEGSPKQNRKLPSEEATSPDFSTSSLISCSEHYNGESLLDNMSPRSPSSPETPEWSLIANGESFHKDVPTPHPSLVTMGESTDADESLISSRDNRVIITISPNTGPEAASPHTADSPQSPGASSGGTLTPERQQEPPQPLASPPYSPPTSLGGLGSSEEESDMESLHSYHPPVKVVDIPSAHRLAKRLYNLEGFHKSDISRHLSKNNEFSRAVADEYCKLFGLEGLSLDQALRLFLGQFCLTGETQDRERVLLHFSRRFLDTNPSLRGATFRSHDAVHTLTCAIMLLNTDLHNEALQQRRMSAEEFVENLAELNDGENFPDPVLRQVYSAIRSQPIEWVVDSEGESPPPSSPAPSSPSLASEVSFTDQVGGINPFLSLPDPETAVDYKRGYVMRKACFDPNYKKTKLGKRSWKMFYLTLRDLVLYCHKDEKTASLSSSFESPSSAVRLHHGLAMAATDYSKKQFVFRLSTADRAEYLFQTSDQKELETWVETINTVVARYSSPALPAPCSNIAKQFQRPLYPSSRSSHSLAAQLQSHRNQVSELSSELGEHVTRTPAKGAKAVIWGGWREKGDFLQSEVARYSTYIKVLESIISRQGSTQLASSPLKVITS